jgi:fibro-slime domain-containing protein/MYXO-CTERM domain-containing protein
MTLLARRAALLAFVLSSGIAANAAAIELSGTIRDFCAPSIATPACTQLSDFEGEIPGLVTQMVSPTLNASGLPDPGANLTFGATNAANFAKWYVNSAGVNLSQAFSLNLAETAPGSGVFSYSNGAFFPIDGQLYGNQTQVHNYHFTLHLEGLTSFTAGDTFTFTGDDDLWIYVGGKLVMDLGGVHPPVSDTISGADLLALGLSENTVYDLDIFFAERHTSQSSFTITTSFRLNEVPEPSPLALAAAAVVGATVVRRRGRGSKPA